MSALEFITFIVLGATVGGFVGTIGIGGSALMTPALIFLGMPVHIAVGTDLLYAGISKSALFTLLIGSVPGAQVGIRKTSLMPGAVIKQIIAFFLLVVGGVTSTVALP